MPKKTFIGSRKFNSSEKIRYLVPTCIIAAEQKQSTTYQQHQQEEEERQDLHPRSPDVPSPAVVVRVRPLSVLVRDRQDGVRLAVGVRGRVVGVSVVAWNFRYFVICLYCQS